MPRKTFACWLLALVMMAGLALTAPALAQDDDADFDPVDPAAPAVNVAEEDDDGSFILLAVIVGLGLLGGGWYGWGFFCGDDDGGSLGEDLFEG